MTNADLIYEGYVCQSCSELIDGDDPGYPRDCEDCEKVYY